MENQKFRVWWRKLDEDGNEIERGVDDREYVSFGHAHNRGYKLFGYRNKQVTWRVSYRDPWAKYTCEVTCSVCGQIFLSEEHCQHENFPIGADSVYVYTKSDSLKPLIDGERYPDYNGYCCPDCAKKIHNFISGLRKGE